MVLQVGPVGGWERFGICLRARWAWPYRRAVFATCLLVWLSVGNEAIEEAGLGDRPAEFIYTGAFLYGSPSVNGYENDATTGTLNNAAGTPFAMGGKVYAIVAHPSGKFVYVASSGSTPTVAAFNVDTLGGTLVPVSGSLYS